MIKNRYFCRFCKIKCEDEEEQFRCCKNCKGFKEDTKQILWAELGVLFMTAFTVLDLYTSYDYILLYLLPAFALIKFVVIG